MGPGGCCELPTPISRSWKKPPAGESTGVTGWEDSGPPSPMRLCFRDDDAAGRACEVVSTIGGGGGMSVPSVREK